MKIYIDAKRKHFEFVVDDWVWLQLQIYRENSLWRHGCQKLSKCYFGPFVIEAKISSMAYRLRLPTDCHMFPVFHISLLKPCKGNPMEIEQQPLLVLSMDTHPIALPIKVIGYQIISVHGKKV